MTFEELRLAEPILRAVAAAGYTVPTPIQSKAIPDVVDGRDLLGCAQTGTGKTGAFAMPMLHNLARTTAGRGSHAGQGRTPGALALVLCPTRELATQIFESFNAYGRHLPLRHAVVFGGVNQSRQVSALRTGVDVLVATPGRLLDLMGQGFIDLSAIEVLVLDEADRMLDMGFIRDIQRVVEHLPKRRQTLLFSATMPDEIRGLADSLLHRPVFVEAHPVSSTVDLISQSVYMVIKKNKPELLARLLGRPDMARTLVFTRTKHGADKLIKVLRRSSIEARAIHGNKSQNARTRALAGFKSGDVAVLIATDIASRGIDVDEITHVINFDLPNVPETYVHRIGRTARAGASGTAHSFCDIEEIDHLRAIERLIDKTVHVEEDEPDLVYDAPAHSPKRAKSGSNEGSDGRRRGGKKSASRGGRGRGSAPGRRRRRRAASGSR